MARTPQSSARRAAMAAADAASPQAALAAGPAAGLNALSPAAALNTPWAHDAFGALLLQAQSLFKLLEAVQQSQVRAWHDASSDMGDALVEFDEAGDAAAWAAIPGHLLKAQWQHALENAGNTAGRLLEIESAWLQQVQSQAADQLAGLAAAGNGAPHKPPPAGGNGAVGGAVDGDGTQAWQQWMARWQEGIREMSGAWNEALRAVQPRA
jgi:hypothetical protein